MKLVRPAEPAALDGGPAMYPLLSPPEAAKMLGCSRDHVHALMDAGDLPFVTLNVSTRLSDSGRVVKRVRSDQLRQFIESRTVDPR
jgi:excisionase family DNA binding protein